jgi:hypothetical protein
MFMLASYSSNLVHSTELSLFDHAELEESEIMICGRIGVASAAQSVRMSLRNTPQARPRLLPKATARS